MSSATFARLGSSSGDLRSRLSVFLELEWRGQQLRRALDESESLAFDELLGNVLAVVLGQRRLGIEEVDLRRRAGHEQIDDPFDLGREMERAPRRRLTLRRREEHAVHQRSEREAADAERGLLEKVPARHHSQAGAIAWIGSGALHSFVTASSRFRSTLATMVHADQLSRRGRIRYPTPVVIELLLVHRDKAIDLGRLRVAREDQLDAERGARPCIAANGNHPTAQCARGLERCRIVQKGQGLERRVRADAADGAVLAARRVERHEARIGRGAAPERIQAAPIAILTGARCPLVAVVRHVPDAVGLHREHARAEHLRAEQAAGRQRDVANHLGLHADPRTARQQPVVRISFCELRRHG